jgi:hypothetical protein
VFPRTNRLTPEPRGVPGSATMLTGGTPVLSVKEPLPPKHDAVSDSKKNTGKQVGSKQSKQQERSDTEEQKQGAPQQMLTSSKKVGTEKQHKDDEAHHEIK